MRRIYFKSSYQKECQEVLNRINGDIVPYFLTMYSRKDFIGFFATIRLLFPIIEHLTRIYYPYPTVNKSKKYAQNEYDKEIQSKYIPLILKELGIKLPYIVWKMFRHTLSHNDKCGTYVIGRTFVSWGIDTRKDRKHSYLIKKVSLKTISPHNHEIKINREIRIQINSFKLLNDLIAFLQNEIKFKSPRRTYLLNYERLSRKEKSPNIQNIISEIETFEKRAR